jgi:hypothetical protein
MNVLRSKRNKLRESRRKLRDKKIMTLFGWMAHSLFNDFIPTSSGYKRFNDMRGRSCSVNMKGLGM